MTKEKLVGIIMKRELSLEGVKTRVIEPETVIEKLKVSRDLDSKA